MAQPTTQLATYHQYWAGSGALIVEDSAPAQRQSHQTRSISENAHGGDSSVYSSRQNFGISTELQAILDMLTSGVIEVLDTPVLASSV